eukprot:TRINITY_DN47955_c0_g1_i1.p1 TRINITY_DN47955_c0_g1~~TRINITY_DN47955_c0_g1_i1.p1  ORF type:complete len:740 (-),score=269.58 TRINITY_DN47955_c0_g1_i1:134-2353(-)
MPAVMSRLALVASAVAVASSTSTSTTSGATPIEKVLKLLTDLKAEVKKEGDDEKKTYDTFAKFCTDTEAAKKTAISDNESQEETSTATISQKQGTLGETNADIKSRTKADETLNSEKTENTRTCAKDLSTYTAANADLEAAIAGLTGAVTKMEAGKTTANAFLQVGFQQEAQKALELAEAMGLIDSQKRKKATAFLQGPWSEEKGAEHNKKEYGFQSDSILTLLKDLKTDFEGQKKDADDDEAKRVKACTDTNKAKDDAIKANSDAMKTAKGDAATLEGDIADEKETLLKAKKELKVDRGYLAELQANCAARAKDHEQRTTMRADEVKAIEAAVTIIDGKVKEADAAVKGDDFIQLNSEKEVTMVRPVEAAPSFVQTQSMSQVSLSSQSQTVSASKAQLFKMVERSAAFIAKSAVLHQSSRMQGLAVMMSLKEDQLRAEPNAAASPLATVQKLVKDLVNKLLKEAEEDASQKGMCDTQMGLAKAERKRRMAESNKLSAKIKKVDAKRTELLDANEVMADELTKLRKDLTDATKLRADESSENSQTIKDAKEGTEAVAGAIEALQAFYKKARKTTENFNKGAFLQESEDQAPPEVAEGGYGAKQGAAVGIISMMEVIQGDFDKTIKTTKSSEDKAADEFSKLKSKLKVDIGSKEAATEMNENDIKECTNKLAETKENLSSTMKLLDGALQTLEDLKPQCVDNQMSYAERKAKRDGQITDLKKAMCLLDTNSVEPECKEEE